MAVATRDLRPYMSFQLGVRPTRGDPDGFVTGVLDDVAGLLGTTGHIERTLDEVGLPEQHRRVWLGWLTYHLRRAPAWAPESELQDETNQLVVVALRDRHVAIYTSDPGMATRIRGKPAEPGDGEPGEVGLTSGLAAIHMIPAGTLNAAFTHGPADSPGGPIRTLWLEGIHRPTASKPDSKVLSGPDLRYALDPLGDQTFHATAARASVKLPNLTRPRAVGFNARKSRAWAGPTHDWDEFARFAYALLGRVKQATGEPPDQAPLPILAVPAKGPVKVGEAYDMSVVAPEVLSDTVILDPEIDQLAQRWAYDARFVVAPTAGPDFEADVFLHDRRVGTLAFEVTVGDDGAAETTIKARGSSPRLKEARRACRLPGWLTVRYESGHTLAGGVVYSTRFRDLPFEGWEFWPMPGVDVTKEKPPTSRNFDPAQIGKGDSLFCWVKHHWPPPTGANPGWLACDDGAGEIADFVHVDEAARRITLIHVKASDTKEGKRQISTSDYEVVVGQAVKNLRQLDRINLAHRLDAGKHKSVAAATWHDGRKQRGRTGLVKAVKRLGADYQRRVVVVQPRVTAAEHQWALQEHHTRKDSSRVRRLQQLDSLLNEAQSACRDLGAEFVVIGEQQV